MLFVFLAAMALSGAGCSGINTGTSVSPLDFLMPGMGHLIKADPAPTNSPASFPETSTELALTK
ncbi:MAG TPA: hypothetical protein VHX90_02980 [Verrucomicrobiae bacterium]|jgi:hypothetical protein|nr:hypothetical protein [Verrucomicrobiae bacterium]